MYSIINATSNILSEFFTKSATNSYFYLFFLQVEEEIQTLRHVLASKIGVSHVLKRKLGISVWRELSDDVNQGFRSVKESQVYVSMFVLKTLRTVHWSTHDFTNISRTQTKKENVLSDVCQLFGFFL